MKQNKNINPFDNLLMEYITRESHGSFVSGSSDKEAEIVFAKQFNATLPKDRADALLSSLKQSLSKDTLGSLIQVALSINNTNLVELQTNTGLTPSLIEDIKTDMVFTNSVPVKSLVKLLKLLDISLEKAKSAIDATFERLSTESKIFSTIPIKAQPSFRKGVSIDNGSFDMMRLKSDESYLYQNKEALDKYTKRLSELYSEF